ncbi:hypothetical protein [Acinetobacter venetianus]|uniref:hypothetical protein n=1 Tax=Acinetobacter venetianus TaxID=52133 RepID=UPI003A90614F
MGYKDMIGFEIPKSRTNDQAAMQLDDLSSAAKSMSDVDSIDTLALNSEIQANRFLALAILIAFANDIINSDLEETETPSDRLDALLSVAEDESDTENYALSILIANIQDAAYSLGVPEEVAQGAFDDTNIEVQDEYLESLAEFVNSNIPDGEEFEQFRDDFVYGSPDKFDPEDPEQLDALGAGKTTVKKRNGRTLVYRAVKAIRNGKVKIVNKKIAGSAKLSAKQKQAVKRMQAKSNRGAALKKRLRSLQKGRNANLY